MHIGFDIDGVILDFERQMHYYAEMYDLLILNKDGKVNNDFNYLNNYNWTDNEKKYFIEKFLIKGTIDCNLVVGVKEVLRMLKELNYKISFITSRGLLNENTIEYVTDKLLNEDIIVDNIYFKTKDKVEICEKLNIDIMIEDNPDICTCLSNNKIKTLYLRDESSKKLDENECLKQVNDFSCVLREILKLSNNNKDREMCMKIFKKNINNY